MENFKFSKDLIQQAKEAKSAKELQEMAAKQGVSITMEEAETGYERLHPAAKELSDEELDNVSGGGCNSEPEPIACKKCGGTKIIFVTESRSYYCWDCKSTTVLK